MRTPTCIVKPDATGDGSRLTGPGLRYALWFDDECAAGNRARQLLAESGGRVVFFDSHGTHIITESVAAPCCTRGGAGAVC